MNSSHSRKIAGAFGCAAFAFGGALRAIPELIAGSNPIGFDTVYYAGKAARLSSCLDYNSFGDVRTLMFLLCPLAKAFTPLVAVKILSVLLYAFLGLSSYYFAKKTLGLKAPHALATAVLILLQVATLRIGWDLHRNLLALSIFLVLLTYLEFRETRKQIVHAAILSALVALSHEIVAGLMLAVAVGLILWRALEKESGRLWILIPPLTLGSIPVLWVLTEFLPGTSVGYAASSQSLAERASAELLLVATLFLPSSLLAIFGRRRVRTLIVWLGAVAIGLGASLLGVAYMDGVWVRWLLMLVFPVGFFAGLGLQNLSGWISGIASRFLNKRHGWIRGLVTVLILAPYLYLAWGFMSAPSGEPLWYFDNPALWTGGQIGVPSTMQSNTVPLAGVDDVEAAISWLNKEMGDHDVLLTHAAFYGWALLYLNREKGLVTYGSSGIEYGLRLAAEQGFRRAYVIWFTPGYGWHSPDPDLTGWMKAFQSGNIVVYTIDIGPVYTQYS